VNSRRSLTANQVVSAILARGGEFVRQKDSHRLYVVTGDDGQVIARTTVAMHKGDVPNGTLSAIEKDMRPAFGEGWLR
jgi:predicted RNA binding protein YcfA (HicA-like mRNA interferase family)